jgi:hypothetical protein
MKTIQIGLEVHKAIEAARLSLAEPENAVLMRLLGIAPLESEAPVLRPPQRGAWAKEGVELPEGTHLKAEYSDQTVLGAVSGGRWVINGRAYSSPSMALIDSVTTRDGRRTNLNGWNHWWVKRPGDPDFIRLAGLRKRG